MDRLFEFSNKKINEVKIDFTRYKYHDIKWEGRMFGLVGPRGIGKTTMLLQYIKQNLSVADTLYVSADHIYFSDHSLLDLADTFSKMNGKHLFIDEVHKYGAWSQELKQIYDTYSDMQVVFTGSSILDIYKGISDLSRRAPIYEMQGLSFREFLYLFHGIKVPTYTLAEILTHKVEPIEGVPHPLPLFNEYLRQGYYPFALDVDFTTEIQQVITLTMENDIPQYAHLNVSVGKKLKQLLMVIAKSVPFKPVMQKLSEVTGISRNYIPDYLYYIERAGMISQLQDDTSGIRGLGKVEKIYLDNTNLIYALTPSLADIGNVRETFFNNQMRIQGDIASSRTADFTINNLTFEIGGKNKGKRQIATAENGFIVKDDIETGYANVIPLYHFGLLY